MSKVYIGNLTFDHDPRDLEEDFAKFGTILQCAVKRGFAFIHYEDANDAAAAVKEMDGVEWHGRRLRVAFSTSSGDTGNRDRERERTQERPRDPQREGQITRNLFVANIAPDVKLSELEDFFEAYGVVENVKILPQARGNAAMSAFVDFRDDAAAQKAHDGELILAGQRLRTDYNFRRSSDARRPDDSDPRERDRDFSSSRPRRDSYDGRSSHGQRSRSDQRRPSSRSRSRSRDNRNEHHERSRGYGRPVESYRRERSRSPNRDRGYDRGSHREREYRNSPRDNREREPQRHSSPSRYDRHSERNNPPRRD